MFKIKMTEYRIKRTKLANDLVRKMLLDHKIVEVTTKRQEKNGTREFEFPVPASNNSANPNGKKLRLAIFKTGYVRNQNSCYSNYQLNPTYKRKEKFVFFNFPTSSTFTKTYEVRSRALIPTELARLQYMLDYYLRNYKTNTK